MESEQKFEPLDELIDNLLRDKDFLLAQELKHRIIELNELLQQAHSQRLKVCLVASHSEVNEFELAHAELKISKDF